MTNVLVYENRDDTASSTLLMQIYAGFMVVYLIQIYPYNDCLPVLSSSGLRAGDFTTDLWNEHEVRAPKHGIVVKQAREQTRYADPCLVLQTLDLGNVLDNGDHPVR